MIFTNKESSGNHQIFELKLITNYEKDFTKFIYKCADCPSGGRRRGVTRVTGVTAVICGHGWCAAESGSGDSRDADRRGTAGRGGRRGRGVRERRSDGKLPAHVITYLTLALALFPDDDYEEVATGVTGSLDRFG